MQRAGVATFYVLVVVWGCKDPPTLQPSSPHLLTTAFQL